MARPASVPVDPCRRAARQRRPSLPRALARLLDRVPHRPMPLAAVRALAPALVAALVAPTACSSPPGPPPAVELGEVGPGADAPDADGPVGPVDAPAPGRSDADDADAPADLAALGSDDLAEVLRAGPGRMSTLATGRSRMRLEIRHPDRAPLEAITDCAWDLDTGAWSCTTWILEGHDLLDAVTLAVHPGGAHQQVPHDPSPGTAPGPHRPSPAPWVPHPAGPPAEPFTQDAVASSTASPVLLLLGVADRAEAVGSQDVGGVPTLVVATTLDIARALELAPPAVADRVGGYLGDWAHPGDRPVAVWLDAAGVPRRMRLELPADPLDPPIDPADPADLVDASGDDRGVLHGAGGGGRMVLTLELADLGEPVQVALPDLPGGDGG